MTSPQPVEQEPCVAGSASQTWTFTPSADGYMLENSSNSECLDLDAFDAANGTPIMAVQWSDQPGVEPESHLGVGSPGCPSRQSIRPVHRRGTRRHRQWHPGTIQTCVADAASQRWQLTSAGEFALYGTSRCLDAQGAQTADGTPVIVWPCNGQTNRSGRSMAAPAFTAASTCRAHQRRGQSDVAGDRQTARCPDPAQRYVPHGCSAAETVLSPATVNSSQFGKLYTLSLDGQDYAQPLYVADLPISGMNHNVLCVATMNNSVYAFDADSSSSTPLWQVKLGVLIPEVLPHNDPESRQAHIVR